MSILPSLILLAALPSPQVQTDDHDDLVRRAVPANEGAQRFAPPAPAYPARPAPGSGLGAPARGDRGQLGPSHPVVYDVATGVETVLDAPGSDELFRWVAGRALNDLGATEPTLAWDSDPTPVSSQSFPWSAQVRVFGTDSNGVAFELSGTMIDPRHVITVGQAVHGGAGESWSNGVSIAPAWDGDDDAFGSAFATHFGAFNGWINSSNPAEDVGFIRFSRPVGFLTGWLGYGYDTDDSFYLSNFFNLAAYPDASSCYSGAPDQMYYGFGQFDSVSSTLLHADASWSCTGDGMEGGGSYAILGGDRFVHATHRLHDPGGANDIEQTRLRQVHVDFFDNSMQPGAYSTSEPDYVPLDIQADTGGGDVLAGEALASMDYLVANNSLFDPNGTQTYVVEVYLSTNENISEFDTLIQTHTFDLDFGPLEAHRVVVSSPPVIPADTATGNYWLGVIFRSFNGDLGNDDSDGRDAFPLSVRGCRTGFTPFGVGLPGSGGFAPVLYGVGESCQQAGHSIEMAGGLGGARGNLWIGVGSDDLFPIWGGHFYIDITQTYFSVPVRASGQAGVPGVGTFRLPGGDVRNFAGLDLYLQISLLDAGAVKGISLTNGLTLHILP